MARVFYVPRTSFSLTAGNDIATIVAGATRTCALVEIYLGGMGTTSAANEIMISRQDTVGVTPGGGLNVKNPDGSVPAFTGNVYSTWGTQPILTAGDYIRPIAINANGGQVRMTFGDGGIRLDATAALSIRCISGSSTIVMGLIIEEY